MTEGVNPLKRCGIGLAFRPVPSRVFQELTTTPAGNSSPQRFQHLRRSHHLPHMPLRVIRHMNQRSTN